MVDSGRGSQGGISDSLTLHGFVIPLSARGECLALLVSKEMGADLGPRHLEVRPFMAAEPAEKGRLVLERLAEGVSNATLVSFDVCPTAAGAEAWERRHERIDMSIADEDPTHIGLDELVDAFLIPAFDYFADHEYWVRLVRLTCAVFGLERHARDIEIVRASVAASVVPLQGALEVPSAVAVAFERHRPAINRLTREMQLLQRGYIRDFLLALDPELAVRSTTIGRLRELGLPRRRFFDVDDM